MVQAGNGMHGDAVGQDGIVGWVITFLGVGAPAMNISALPVVFIVF